MAAVCLGQHTFHGIIRVFYNLERIHGIYTGTYKRMVQLIHDP